MMYSIYFLSWIYIFEMVFLVLFSLQLITVCCEIVQISPEYNQYCIKSCENLHFRKLTQCIKISAC